MTRSNIEFVVPMSIGGLQIDDQDAVEVGPLRVQQALTLLPTINLLIGEVANMPPNVMLLMMLPGEDLLQHQRIELAAWAVDLLTRRSDEVMRLVEVATGVTTQRLGALLPDRLIALMLAVIEVNVDFFVRSAPMLGAALASPNLPWNRTVATPLPLPTGGMSSSSSSPMATAMATS